MILESVNYGIVSTWYAWHYDNTSEASMGILPVGQAFGEDRDPTQVTICTHACHGKKKPPVGMHVSEWQADQCHVYTNHPACQQQGLSKGTKDPGNGTHQHALC